MITIKSVLPKHKVRQGGRADSGKSFDPIPEHNQDQ